jgi:hypothetical protein
MPRSDAAMDAHRASPGAHDRPVARNSNRNAIAAHTKKSRAREGHHRKPFNKNRSEFLRSMSRRERTAMRDSLTACNANAGARTQESLAIGYAPRLPYYAMGSLGQLIKINCESST